MWWFRHRVWKIHFSGWFWRAFKVVVEPLLDGCLGWIQGVASMLLSGCQGFCLRGLLECCWTVARLHTSWVVYFTCTLEECEIEFSCIMTKMYVFLLIGFMRPQQEMSNHTFTYCSKYNTRTSVYLDGCRKNWACPLLQLQRGKSGEVAQRVKSLYREEVGDGWLD